MIRPFIAKLGGPKIVATEVSADSRETLKPKSVSQWGLDGAIPHRWRLYLARLAKKKKIKDVPPEIRGFMQ